MPPGQLEARALEASASDSNRAAAIATIPHANGAPVPEVEQPPSSSLQLLPQQLLRPLLIGALVAFFFVSVLIAFFVSVLIAFFFVSVLIAFFVSVLIASSS